jgi:hypothetical protein
METSAADYAYGQWKSPELIAAPPLIEAAKIAPCYSPTLGYSSKRNGRKRMPIERRCRWRESWCLWSGQSRDSAAKQEPIEEAAQCV